MTQFEFFIGGYSIVLALSVARLLEGLRAAFDPARRFWIHALWVVIKLGNAAVYFWGSWQFAGLHLEFTEFLALVSAPTILFLQANTLVTSRPDGVEQWSVHFWEIRRWFFGANIVLALVTGVTMVGVADLAFPSPMAISISIVLLLSILGFASANERLHGIVAIALFANLVIGLGALSFGTLDSPGASTG